ncbi:MAG: hypothetical protein PSX81_16200 [bacterium]|nr:hypothetical protein [bacterium]
MKIKNILFFVLFFGLIRILDAQNIADLPRDSTGKVPFRKRLVFNIGGGGGFGSTNGQSTININLQPQVGYRITNRLIAGVGANYQFLKFGPFKYQVYGGNTYVRYLISQQFFVQTEYQLLNYSYQNANTGWNDYVLIGGGYFPGGGFYISAYYLLKFPPNNNIYGAPYIIRAGFSF